MYLFGYTNPDVLNRQQEETPSDGTHMYNGSFFKRMENFKTIKEISGEYPRVNIQVIPDKFNDFTINSVAANYNLKPVYLVIFIKVYQMMKNIILTVNNFSFLLLTRNILLILINFHHYI